MHGNTRFDSLFHDAVSAVDAGDEEKLKHLLREFPEQVADRLYSSGKWLTDAIPHALKSFFKDPFLLWFVSEDAARIGTLPQNIANIASIIIDRAKMHASSFREQVDYALKLVAWSPVARKCGVQIALLDVLINAGAAIDGVADDALVNGNFDAARHLSQKGARLTLSTALCLERWHEADQLALSATSDLRQFTLVLALNGKVEAVRKAIAYGADVNMPSNYLYSHATALHHSVGSGNSETVKVLVRVGADLNARDAAYGASPLGWAVYGRHKEIEDYLRKGGAQE